MNRTTFEELINNIMVFRRDSRLFFRKYQHIAEYIFRFFTSFFAYFGVTHELNYKPVLGMIPICIGVGILGMFIPDIIIILLCVLVAIYEVYVASPILALMTLAVFIVLYCFAARFSGKFAYAIIAIPLLMKINMHYFIALLLGMTATPLAVFPALVGVAVYYVLGIVNSAVLEANVKSMDDILALYVNFLGSLFANQEMISVMIVFALVIIVLCVIRKFHFAYSFEIAIAVGGFLMMIVFAIANIIIPGTIHIGAVIIGTVISMLLMGLVQFFTRLLNYKRVEETQFEDDEYYYYVTAVPKMDKYTEAEVGDLYYPREATYDVDNPYEEDGEYEEETDEEETSEDVEE